MLPVPAASACAPSADGKQLTWQDNPAISKNVPAAGQPWCGVESDREEEGGCDMPRGDGTGPASLGPMTGRGAGYCAGYPVAGFLNRLFGRGFGGSWGRGGGFGWRNRFYATGLTGWQRAGMGAAPPYAPYGPDYGAPFTREQQMDALKGQAGYLQSELEAIRKRLAELEAKTGEE